MKVLKNKSIAMDASIETYNRKLTETSMLKQQLENQIALLKEQIHSARMNDEHYANRAQSIERELSEREEQLGTLISELDKTPGRIRFRPKSRNT